VSEAKRKVKRIIIYQRIKFFDEFLQSHAEPRNIEFPIVLLFENFYHVHFFSYLLHQHSRIIEG